MLEAGKRHLTGTLRLRTGVRLHVPANTTLLVDLKYDPAAGDAWYLVLLEKCTRCSVEGGGSIDGRGADSGDSVALIGLAVTSGHGAGIVVDSCKHVYIGSSAVAAAGNALLNLTIAPSRRGLAIQLRDKDQGTVIAGSEESTIDSLSLEGVRLEMRRRTALPGGMRDLRIGLRGIGQRPAP
ncbi:hypothetical protein WJX81_000948 [Elliptochloris bilobata]|uniref:Uncharacterized protein n=1 Tax=Elliptochloris bilobata TaxID=381761 RepID=A0AAW1QJU1_9CHLO